MITEVQKHLLTALKEIKESPISTKHGICGNVNAWVYQERRKGQIGDHCFMSYSGELMDNISRWLTETGSTFTFHYPVGGAAQYRGEVETCTIWNNPKRWELLDWMINRLEALDI